jgi:hypothetical protein
MADISTLQQSLINAKKVMNKVDSGSFSKTGGDTPRRINMPTENTNLTTEQVIPQAPVQSQSPVNLNPKSQITEDKIKNSNLPDAIKTAMINNPIPDIPFNGGGVGLSEDFLSGVKNEMAKQGIPTTQTETTQKLNSTPQPKLNKVKKSQKLTSSGLKSLIKESVQELLNETLGIAKDNDDNFQFRVGDRLFYGKITSSKKIK